MIHVPGSSEEEETAGEAGPKLPRVAQRNSTSRGEQGQSEASGSRGRRPGAEVGPRRQEPATPSSHERRKAGGSSRRQEPVTPGSRKRRRAEVSGDRQGQEATAGNSQLLRWSPSAQPPSAPTHDESGPSPVAVGIVKEALLALHYSSWSSFQAERSEGSLLGVLPARLAASRYDSKVMGTQLRRLRNDAEAAENWRGDVSELVERGGLHLRHEAVCSHVTIPLVVKQRSFAMPLRYSTNKSARSSAAIELLLEGILMHELATASLCPMVSGWGLLGTVEDTPARSETIDVLPFFISRGSSCVTALDCLHQTCALSGRPIDDVREAVCHGDDTPGKRRCFLRSEVDLYCKETAFAAVRSRRAESHEGGETKARRWEDSFDSSSAELLRAYREPAPVSPVYSRAVLLERIEDALRQEGGVASSHHRGRARLLYQDLKQSDDTGEAFAKRVFLNLGCDPPPRRAVRDVTLYYNFVNTTQHEDYRDELLADLFLLLRDAVKIPHPMDSFDNLSYAREEREKLAQLVMEPGPLAAAGKLTKAKDFLHAMLCRAVYLETNGVSIYSQSLLEKTQGALTTGSKSHLEERRKLLSGEQGLERMYDTAVQLHCDATSRKSAKEAKGSQKRRSFAGHGENSAALCRKLELHKSDRKDPTGFTKRDFEGPSSVKAWAREFDRRRLLQNTEAVETRRHRQKHIAGQSEEGGAPPPRARRRTRRAAAPRYLPPLHLQSAFNTMTGVRVGTLWTEEVSAEEESSAESDAKEPSRESDGEVFDKKLQRAWVWPPTTGATAKDERGRHAGLLILEGRLHICGVLLRLLGVSDEKAQSSQFAGEVVRLQRLLETNSSELLEEADPANMDTIASRYLETLHALAQLLLRVQGTDESAGAHFLDYLEKLQQMRRPAKKLVSRGVVAPLLTFFGILELLCLQDMDGEKKTLATMAYEAQPQNAEGLVEILMQASKELDKTPEHRTRRARCRETSLGPWKTARETLLDAKKYGSSTSQAHRTVKQLVGQVRDAESILNALGLTAERLTPQKREALSLLLTRALKGVGQAPANLFEYLARENCFHTFLLEAQEELRKNTEATAAQNLRLELHRLLHQRDLVNTSCVQEAKALWRDVVEHAGGSTTVALAELGVTCRAEPELATLSFKLLALNQNESCGTLFGLLRRCFEESKTAEKYVQKLIPLGDSERSVAAEMCAKLGLSQEALPELEGLVTVWRAQSVLPRQRQGPSHLPLHILEELSALLQKNPGLHDQSVRDREHTRVLRGFASKRKEQQFMRGVEGRRFAWEPLPPRLVCRLPDSTRAPPRFPERVVFRPTARKCPVVKVWRIQSSGSKQCWSGLFLRRLRYLSKDEDEARYARELSRTVSDVCSTGVPALHADIDNCEWSPAGDRVWLTELPVSVALLQESREGRHLARVCSLELVFLRVLLEWQYTIAWLFVAAAPRLSAHGDRARSEGKKSEETALGIISLRYAAAPEAQEPNWIARILHDIQPVYQVEENRDELSMDRGRRPQRAETFFSELGKIVRCSCTKQADSASQSHDPACKALFQEYLALRRATVKVHEQRRLFIEAQDTNRPSHVATDLKTVQDLVSKYSTAASDTQGNYFSTLQTQLQQLLEPSSHVPSSPLEKRQCLAPPHNDAYAAPRSQARHPVVQVHGIVEALKSELRTPFSYGNAVLPDFFSSAEKRQKQPPSFCGFACGIDALLLESPLTCALRPTQQERLRRHDAPEASVCMRPEWASAVFTSYALHDTTGVLLSFQYLGPLRFPELLLGAAEHSSSSEPLLGSLEQNALVDRVFVAHNLLLDALFFLARCDEAKERGELLPGAHVTVPRKLLNVPRSRSAARDPCACRIVRRLILDLRTPLVKEYVVALDPQASRPCCTPEDVREAVERRGRSLNWPPWYRRAAEKLEDLQIIAPQSSLGALPDQDEREVAVYAEARKAQLEARAAIDVVTSVGLSAATDAVAARCLEAAASYAHALSALHEVAPRLSSKYTKPALLPFHELSSAEDPLLCASWARRLFAVGWIAW